LGIIVFLRRLLMMNLFDTYEWSYTEAKPLDELGFYMSNHAYVY